MTKNKKGKVVQMLTPENYIRKKARSLPIFECLVASEWEESGLPTVVIARKHTTGHITACTYMVDLKCLGVKDSSYLFNVSPTQYREFKDLIQENSKLTPVDYALVHNIVLAGVEYAEELGFKPYKDYESVTKFMLEEDTDEIELMEIECGQNGKPFYVQGPYDDIMKAQQIITHLEKVVGRGNFDYILNTGKKFNNLFDNEDEDEEDDLLEEDEYDHWTFKEKQDLFFSLLGRVKNMQTEDVGQLGLLTDSMINDLVDKNLYNQYYDQMFEELDLEVTDEDIPDELLGINPGEQVVEQQWKDRFFDIFLSCNENPKKAEKEIKLFNEETKGIPAVHLLELILLQAKKSSKYAKRLKEYALLYPDYAMIQLLRASLQVIEREDLQQIPEYPFRAEAFFDGRATIHNFEYMQFLVLYSFVLGVELDINKIEAYSDVIYALDMPDDLEKTFTETTTMLRFTYLFKYMQESTQ